MWKELKEIESDQYKGSEKVDEIEEVDCIEKRDRPEKIGERSKAHNTQELQGHHGSQELDGFTIDEYGLLLKGKTTRSRHSRLSDNL